jgi:hypothetical protein
VLRAAGYAQLSQPGLTDARQFGILQSAPTRLGANEIASATTTRTDRPARRHDGAQPIDRRNTAAVRVHPIAWEAPESVLDAGLFAHKILA